MGTPLICGSRLFAKAIRMLIGKHPAPRKLIILPRACQPLRGVGEQVVLAEQVVDAYIDVDYYSYKTSSEVP
jgi:hypothetical protein